jgi:FAD/FMN-containing dehydrogenase
MKSFLLALASRALCGMLLWIAGFNAYAATKCPEYPSIVRKQLQKYGVVLSSDKQMDYPRITASNSCYLEVWPKNTAETAEIVKIAYQHHLPIRTQGGSHSFNGSSLPHERELLIHTNAMNKVTIISADEIVAGSGVPVCSINLYLNQYGMRIPIENSGDIIGPTVGGFISSGGVSPQSPVSGGLWDQINEITLVTGGGRVMRITNKDPEYLWFFGSMGQLGIITEARMKTYSAPAQTKLTLPIGKAVPIEFKENGGRYHASNVKHIPELWFALFVAPEQVDSAAQDLSILHDTNPSEESHLVKYVINTKSPPPLLYSGKGNFYLVSLFWYKNDNAESTRAFIQQNDTLNKIVRAKKYNRYIQSELSGGPAVYKNYFSDVTYRYFRGMKVRLDPQFLFNKGSFFSAN